MSELFNNVDFRDVEVYVNRPPEDRRTGLDVVQGAAKKPLNCFFLYKKVYKDHTADLFPEKSQNMISCILGASWRMESNFIRNKFRRLADVERSNHKKAFPSNKYASSRKRRTFRNPVE